MKNFRGFTNVETFTAVPDSFFRQLLREIEDPGELKLTLYALWRIEHMEGPLRALGETDFDPGDLGMEPDDVLPALEKAVSRGSLLRAQHDSDVFFFLNSPRGRAAAEAFAQGDWGLSAGTATTSPIERPNLFKLYEENIGPLTPLIADMLKEAEGLYPAEWLEEGITIAVKNNKRNWKYVEAILKRWKDEGTHGQKDRRDALKGTEKYTNSEFSEFIDGG